MKRMYFYLQFLTIVSILCMTTISCSKDDGNTEDDYEKTENLSNQDPDGTIIINMISGSSDNYYTIGNLGQIHIDAANNFRGYSKSDYKIEFVTIGKVDGLGKVNQIPISGWGESAAVVPGTGYMMRYIHYGDVQYARIYVVDYLSSATTDEFGNTTGSNSGAIIKYQTPFKGTDEEIDIEVNSITFDSKGGSQELVFNNKNIIQFTVKSSESWCSVQKSSSLNDAYFSNAIRISVSPSYLPEPRTATVTLTTIYEKEVVVTVTQSGVEPYISISDDMPEVTISAMEQQLTKAISTNYDISDIIVTSSNDWCKAELKSYSYTRAGNDNYSSKSYYLNLNIASNESTEIRTAKITLKSNDGKASATLTIKQEGVYFEIKETDFVVGAQGDDQFIINFTSTISGNSLSAESNAEWCRPSVYLYDYSTKYTENGYLYYYYNRLHLVYDANSDLNDRSAEIKISSKSGNLLATITLTQQGDVITIRGVAEKTISAAKQNTQLYYNSYAGVENLKVMSDVEWCSPTIYNGYIGVEVDNNSSDVARVAKITLSHRNEDSGVQYTITQEGIEVTMPDTLWYDKNSHTDTKSISVNLSDFKGWEVSSSEDWCKPSMNKKDLTLRLSATSEDRIATISFEGISKTIKVVQSKYAVGDEYSEGDINGTVGYMKDNKRYIYKIVGNEVWSNENVLVGATNQNDGMENMTVIKKLPDWKDNYPSFALCDALNTATVNGWYMPSLNELIQLEQLTSSCWSSTEYSYNLAYSNRGGTWNKNEKKDIVAVRKF